MAAISLKATFTRKLRTNPSCRSRDFADKKYLLHHAQFTSDILPDSFKRPYLIKVTSEWCFACIHIEPVWKEAVQELEPLGESAIKRLSMWVKMRQDFITRMNKSNLWLAACLNSTIKIIH